MSAYVLNPDANKETLLKSLELPIKVPLKDGSSGVIRVLDPDGSHCDRVCEIFNKEVERGTYPQNEKADATSFRAYFCSHYAFVLTDSDDNVRGAFYIKPNFPGRCAHICNAGFLVADEYRKIGVGSALADVFEGFAKKLGYRAVFFNLVFCDNKASLALWKNRGFEIIGRVPEAKLVPNPVDAIMMYKKLE